MHTYIVLVFRPTFFQLLQSISDAIISTVRNMSFLNIIDEPKLQ